jgi:imidazolonepropionase
MIPEVTDQGLADYCDVFCEKGFFSPEETRMILEQGLKYGLKPKIHANQLNNSGGVQVGVDCGAVSVDHLENVGAAEIECLKNASTLPTLLPGAAFFLNMNYPPARQMIEAGLPLVKMRMTPNEAITAATFNGACALELQDQLGSIQPGKTANIIITKPMPSIEFLPYSFGSNLIDTVILRGQII